MKALLLISSGLLLIALIDLPIGFYTLLRIVISMVAVFVVVLEFQDGVNFWVIAFGLVAVIFNPLIPVYLNNKEAWIPIDIAASILFLIKAFSRNQKSTT